MGSPAFKAGVRGVPPQAGSIPVHLRHMSADLRAQLHRFQSKLALPAVIGALTDADHLLAVDVVGTRSRLDDTPAGVDDQWHIGSCGKSITAALYACLVEQGLAQWDTPVRDLFPDLTHIDPGWDGPTVDDLFHCRAGMVANPSQDQMRAMLDSTDTLTDQRTAAVATALRTAPTKPGRFVYSNVGYITIGAAIDRLAGQPFEDAARAHLWEPLGITSVGNGPPPLIRGHHPRRRVGPLLAGPGDPALGQDERPTDNPAVFSPAGTFHISVADWARFLRVFLADGAPILSTSSIDRLLRSPAGRGHPMAMGWAPGTRLGATHAMQGSNTMWVATAVMDRTRRRTAMTVTNDGRSRVLSATARFTASLLDRS